MRAMTESSNPSVAELHSMLDIFRVMRKERGEEVFMPHTFEEWAAEKGVPMTARLSLPSHMVHPKSQMCYWNAWLLYLSSSGRGSKQHRYDSLRYCEGFVALPDVCIPVMHGWCVDAKGRVLDPSVEQDRGAAYIGVAFSEAFAVSAWGKLNKWKAIGIVGNIWRFIQTADELAGGRSR